MLWLALTGAAARVCRLGHVTVVQKGPADQVSDGDTVQAFGEFGSPRRVGGQGDIMAGRWAAAPAAAAARLGGAGLGFQAHAACSSSRGSWLPHVRSGDQRMSGSLRLLLPLTRASLVSACSIAIFMAWARQFVQQTEEGTDEFQLFSRT